MKKTKEKGITLIALVVTIIILLILAGVTIGIATNGTGLFDKAKLATDKYNNEVDKENYELGQATNYIENYSTFTRSGGSNINYSTEEQDTGLKWIDGKKIYQKTVSCGELPNKTNKSIAHGIINMDVVVDLKGMAKNGSGLYVTVPLVNKDPGVRLDADATNIYLQSSDDWSNYSNAYITIQYTKTID